MSGLVENAYDAIKKYTDLTILSGGWIAFIKGGSIILGEQGNKCNNDVNYSYIQSMGMTGATFGTSNELPDPIFNKCLSLNEIIDSNNKDYNKKQSTRCFIPMKKNGKWLLFHFKTTIQKTEGKQVKLDFIINGNAQKDLQGVLGWAQRQMAGLVANAINSAGLSACRGDEGCKLEFKKIENKIKYSVAGKWTADYELESYPLYFDFDTESLNKKCDNRSIKDEIIDKCFFIFMDVEWDDWKKALENMVGNPNLITWESSPIKVVILMKVVDLYSQLTRNEAEMLCKELNNEGTISSKWDGTIGKTFNCNTLTPEEEVKEEVKKKNIIKIIHDFKEKFSERVSWLRLRSIKKRSIKKRSNPELTNDSDSDSDSDIDDEETPETFINKIFPEQNKAQYTKFITVEVLTKRVIEKIQEKIKDMKPKPTNGPRGRLYDGPADLLNSTIMDLFKFAILVMSLFAIVPTAVAIGVQAIWGDKEDQTIQDEEDEEEQYNLKF